VSQGATFNDVLHVAKGATFNNVLHVAQGVTLNNTLSVTGGVTLYNKLYVSQGATFNDVLHVAKGVTLNSTLYVTGGVTLYNKLYVSQGATFNDVLHVTKGVTLNSTLYVTGGATFMSNVSVPSNISYLVKERPLIDSLTTVFYTYKDYVPGNNFLGCTTRFRKNTPVTSADDVTYDATNGKFTIKSVGIYKVSLDMKPYYHSGDADQYSYTISIVGLDQNYMFMLTSNSWYFTDNVIRGYPSYNNTSAINKDTAAYNGSLASIIFTNYEANSNSTVSATATLYFYLNVLSVASGSASNSFIFQSDNIIGYTEFSHSSYVIIEKISSSCFTPNSYSGYT
jgi:hypothetical protein